jgi:hypothetical protein
MERRASERTLACFPIHLHQGEHDREHIALIRELSVSGAQVLTRVRPAVGSSLSLTLYVDTPDDGVDAEAKVIRVEDRPEDTLWTQLVAVQFDRPLVGFDAKIKEISERQKRAGM